MSGKSNVVFLRGGLGNQFFQWLFALSLQERGISTELDDSFIRVIPGNQALGRVELQKIFSNLYMPITSCMRALAKVEPIYIRLAHFLGYLRIEGMACWSPVSVRQHYGYYQSSSNWSDSVAQKVHSSISLSFQQKSGENIPHELRNQKYVAIHLRGGDYQQAGYNFTELGVLDASYYSKALSSPHLPDMPIVVVSDDVCRARRIIGGIITPGKKIFHLADITEFSSDPMLALAVMVNSDTLVCANSSFSAMCGYLNSRAKVLAPSPWFRGESLGHISPALPKWHLIASSFEIGQE